MSVLDHPIVCSYFRYQSNTGAVVKCKIGSRGTARFAAPPPSSSMIVCLFLQHCNNPRWRNALSHKLQVMERRSLASHYTLITALEYSTQYSNSERFDSHIPFRQVSMISRHPFLLTTDLFPARLFTGTCTKSTKQFCSVSHLRCLRTADCLPVVFSIDREFEFYEFFHP